MEGSGSGVAVGGGEEPREAADVGLHGAVLAGGDPAGELLRLRLVVVAASAADAGRARTGTPRRGSRRRGRRWR
ncbi:unnamed protein product [Urochloa humidicola]